MAYAHLRRGLQRYRPLVTAASPHRHHTRDESLCLPGTSLHHPPGAQAEVDFYEAFFSFPWGQERAHVISVRSEFSAAALHTAYPVQTQSALLNGIERGLRFSGGVFAVMRFDNLRQAVARVIRGQPRVERDRFVAFRSHYLFEASFTSPGIEGAHEKGGVEGEVGKVPPAVADPGAWGLLLGGGQRLPGRVLRPRPRPRPGGQDPGHREEPPVDRPGDEACMASRRVRFTTTAGLVNELLEARDDRTCPSWWPATPGWSC